jgi:predicted aspartyl protease
MVWNARTFLIELKNRCVWKRDFALAAPLGLRGKIARRICLQRWHSAFVALGYLAACATVSEPPPIPLFRNSAVCDKDDSYNIALIRSQRGRPVAQIAIDGITLDLEVDSGADDSTFTLQGLKKLGISESDGHRISAMVNTILVPIFLFQKNISIGDLFVNNVTFAYYPTSHPTEVDGTIGLNFIKYFATEIDLSDNRLTLYSPACDPAPEMDLSAWAVLPMPDNGDRLNVDVKLDGISLRGTIDSGASASFISLQAANKLGLTSDALASDQKATFHGEVSAVLTYRHRFKELRIGPIVALEPGLFVDLDTSNYEVLIGRDILDKFAFFRSPKRHLLFLRTDSLPLIKGNHIW